MTLKKLICWINFCFYCFHFNEFTSEEFESWAQEIQGAEEDVEGREEHKNPDDGPQDAPDLSIGAQLC